MGVPDDEAGRTAALQGIAPGTAGAIRTELESLREFKGRVDRQLVDLRESEAEPGRMGEDRVDAGTLGSNFAEATGLYRVYDQVHDQLTTLSRLLSAQIDGLSMAVDGVHKGYQGTDDEVARRMWAIQADLQKHYDPKRDPYADDKGHEGGRADDGGHQERPGGGDHDQQQPGDGGSL